MDYCNSTTGYVTWFCLMQQCKHSQCVGTGYPVFFYVVMF